MQCPVLELGIHDDGDDELYYLAADLSMYAIIYHDLRPHARSLSSSQISLVPTTARSLILCTLSSAGRTSSEKTGSPSGIGGAE